LSSSSAIEKIEDDDENGDEYDQLMFSSLVVSLSGGANLLEKSPLGRRKKASAFGGESLPLR
jgi:hypothetical protein